MDRRDIPAILTRDVQKTRSRLAEGGAVRFADIHQSASCLEDPIANSAAASGIVVLRGDKGRRRPRTRDAPTLRFAVLIAESKSLPLAPTAAVPLQPTAPGRAASLCRWHGVAVDANRNVYAGDAGDTETRTITLAGLITTPTWFRAEWL
jgi:hypothetical protein